MHKKTPPHENTRYCILIHKILQGPKNKYCNNIMQSLTLTFSATDTEIQIAYSTWRQLAGLLLGFDTSVVLIFIPVTNLLFYVLIKSTAGKFNCNIKGPSSILSNNWCSTITTLIDGQGKTWQPKGAVTILMV